MGHNGQEAISSHAEHRHQVSVAVFHVRITGSQTHSLWVQRTHCTGICKDPVQDWKTLSKNVEYDSQTLEALALKGTAVEHVALTTLTGVVQLLLGQAHVCELISSAW